MESKKIIVYSLIIVLIFSLVGTFFLSSSVGRIDYNITCGLLDTNESICGLIETDVIIVSARCYMSDELMLNELNSKCYGDMMNLYDCKKVGELEYTDSSNVDTDADCDGTFGCEDIHQQINCDSRLIV